MLDFINIFLADEDGSVTVDWVVLTAAICAIGVAVVVTVRTGARAMAADTSTVLTEGAVSTLEMLGASGSTL